MFKLPYLPIPPTGPIPVLPDIPKPTRGEWRVVLAPFAQVLYPVPSGHFPYISECVTGGDIAEHQVGVVP